MWYSDMCTKTGRWNSSRRRWTRLEQEQISSSDTEATPELTHTTRIHKTPHLFCSKIYSSEFQIYNEKKKKKWNWWGNRCEHQHFLPSPPDPDGFIWGASRQDRLPTADPGTAQREHVSSGSFSTSFTSTLLGFFPSLLWGFRQHWEARRCLRLFRRMTTTPRGGEKENKQDVPNLHPSLVINKRVVGRKRHFIYAQNKTREWRRSKWVAGESESFIWLSVSDQTGVSPPGFTILCQGPSLPLPRLFHVFCFFLFPWTLFLSCPFPSPLAAASRQRSARCRRLLFLSLTPSNLPH